MGICPKANCTSNRRRMGLEHRGRKQRWPANLRAKTSFYGPLARFHQNIRVPIVPLAPTIWPSSPVFSQTLIKVFAQRDGLPSSPMDKMANPGSSVTVVCEDRKGNLWLDGAGPWLGCLKDGVLT